MRGRLQVRASRQCTETKATMDYQSTLCGCLIRVTRSINLCPVMNLDKRSEGNLQRWAGAPQISPLRRDVARHKLKICAAA